MKAKFMFQSIYATIFIHNCRCKPKIFYTYSYGFSKGFVKNLI